jgi:hypothetical protein
LASLLSELCDLIVELRETVAALQRNDDGVKRKAH